MNVIRFGVVVATTTVVCLVYVLPPLPTTSLDLTQGLILCTSSSILTVMAIYLLRGLNINNIKDVILFLIRITHYLVIVFTTSYVFVFSPSSDLAFLLFYTFLCTHWIFLKGECCLSHWEKVLMDPRYKLGDNIYSHPWLEILFGKHLNFSMMSITLIMVFNVGIVLNRFFDSVLLKGILMSLVALSSLYFNWNRFS